MAAGSKEITAQKNTDRLPCPKSHCLLREKNIHYDLERGEKSSALVDLEGESLSKVETKRTCCFYQLGICFQIYC